MVPVYEISRAPVVAAQGRLAISRSSTMTTKFFSYSADAGSARTTLPRVAWTAEYETDASSMRSVASIMSPPLFTSATTRSALCLR